MKRKAKRKPGDPVDKDTPMKWDEKTGAFVIDGPPDPDWERNRDKFIQERDRIKAETDKKKKK